MSRILLVLLAGTALCAETAPELVPHPVIARSADDFVESIGVSGLGGPYITPKNELYGQLPIPPEHLMGVRYSRIEAPQQQPAADLFTAIHKAHGVRYNWLLSWHFRDLSEPRNLATALAALRLMPAAAIASIEGNNEANFHKMSGMPDYPATNVHAKSSQEAFYPAVKADPLLRAIPVMSWNIIGVDIGQGSEHLYGKLTSDACDVIACHAYPFDPAHFRAPLADTASGAMAHHALTCREVQPTGEARKPIIATETGWTSDKPVAETTQARLDPIILAANYSAGVARTYLYDAWGNHPWAIQGHPAGRALTDLTTLLGEATWDAKAEQWHYPDFAPGALAYHLAPLPASTPDKPVAIGQLLLQRGDGRFFLLLWNDVPITNNTTKQLYDFPAVDVAITVGNPLSQVVIHAQQADGSHNSESVAITAHAPTATLTVQVADRVVVVELVPDGGLAATQMRVPAFSRTVADVAVSKEQINPSGLTTCAVTGLEPGRMYVVRLTTSAVRDVPLLLNGALQRASAATSAPKRELRVTATADGLIMVQTMDAPGSLPILERITVLAQPTPAAKSTP